MRSTLPLSAWLSKSRPDSTLIAWQGQHTWSLGQLRRDVSELTEQLSATQGGRWALCFENSYWFIVGLLGTLHAGKIPVIPGHSRASLLEEQHHLFNGILSDHDLAWDGPMLNISALQHADASVSVLPPIQDNSYVELFTSGSTGQPRRVCKPLACLDREAALLADQFGEEIQHCRFIASVVPQHLYGLTFRIMLPMALGLPLHATMLYYAEQLAVLDNQHRYVFISSPAFLKRIDTQLPPPSVSLVLSAGGMLPWNDVCHTQAWLGITPNEIYGSTETGVLAWRNRQHDDTPWQCFPDTHFSLLENKWWVTSPLITQPEGIPLDDTLSFNPEGTFTLLGRRGRVVKIEEKRISLSEVERRLLDIEGIVDAAAVPVIRYGRQAIGVAVVLDERTRLRWQEKQGQPLEIIWRKALIPWLEPVAIPRYWRIMDEIPVNSMNKRVYAQLQELFHETS